METVLERRRHHRLGLPATAALFYEQREAGHYLVQDLCAGGALLTGAWRTGDRAIGEGERVEVLLQLPDGPLLELDAVVVRRSTLSGASHRPIGALAVAFEHQSADSEDAIQEALLGALDPGHRPSQPDLFWDELRIRAPLAQARL